MSLALVAGAGFGFLAASAWWTDGTRRTLVGPTVYAATRVLLAAVRSIHELLWAVLLLAAFGITPLAAILAIAIPYAAILAKVFSELIDEAPRSAARALRESGATPMQAFVFGLLPHALPDMAAYAFYRFECAVRSSAIMGFFGFPTLGYYVAASFENLHYGEVWTYLYALFALIALLDWWSGALRRRFVMSDAGAVIDREVVVRRLRRGRPRRHFLRVSGILFALLVLYAWTGMGLFTADLLSPRRVANLQRFLGELRPYPLQGERWDSQIALAWATDLLVTRAGPAAITTLAISIVAITLAGLGAVLLALPAARPFTSAEPFAPAPRPPTAWERTAWRLTVSMARGLLIFLRAIPEYIWAFLALAVVGANAWAAVFALAIHNAGILGKLNAEVIENLEPRAMSAVRSLGGSRAQIALAVIRPAILPRLLLLFFYRWETCVREATVLGMLGIVSLGFYIQDARARQAYDVVLALILTGAIVVVVGDLVSGYARGAVRRAR
jgi:phosphonate transport system permease protein